MASIIRLMKTDNGIKHYASHQDYLNRVVSSRPLKRGTLKGQLFEKDPVIKAQDKASKVELSDEVKDKAKKKVGEKLKDVSSKIADTALEGKNVVGHVKSEAAVTLKRALDVMIGRGSSDETSVEEKAKVKEIAPKTIHGPNIFFVKGFSLNPFDDGSFGLSEMSENIPKSQKFTWADEDKILEEVKLRSKTSPLILVGHGIGSDTIVNVANRLNSVEHGFRTIDLLVTMDSIGFDNDIIPQNVRRNINYISDQDLFFNDGPNIARRNDLTRVVNHLREESHNEIAESPEVQFEVYENINAILNKFVEEKNLKEVLSEKRS